VVGTAYVVDDNEPSAGRILVFTVSDDKQLVLVSSAATPGAVYNLCAFADGRLLAGINSRVEAFRWQDNMLVSECRHHGNIVVVSLKAKGSYVLVGDLMKSVSLLLYKNDGEGGAQLEELAKDYDSNWMTEVELLSDDVFFGAEHSFNIFTLRRNTNGATEEDRGRLEVCGRFHLGEMINKVRPGSLVMTAADDSNPHQVTPSHLFATTNGAIGVLASLTREQFLFFEKLEAAISDVVNPIGGLRHKDWRAFSTERKSIEKSNFIDGDLVELFLDLSPEDAQRVADRCKFDVNEVYKRVEDISRIK